MPVKRVLAPATGSAPVLELAGIGVRRGEAWLLAEATLVVMPGERWVMVGPNGAGKSTLLAVAATNLFPTVGRVLGAELGRVDARTLRPRIGLTSAALAECFDARLRAREVVVTARTGALAPWWDTYAERDQARALELLRQLGVGDLAERTFGTLSTGERQRVLLEEIPPGFGQAMVLAGGRVLAAGPIDGVLVDATLSAAYGIPLRVEGRDGR